MRPDIIRVVPAGDFRRAASLWATLSLVAEVTKLPHGPQTIAPGGQLTTYLTDVAHYGVTLLLATGSEWHLASLRTLAAERNMSLDESGLWHAGELVAAASEDDIYRALGMQAGAPGLREGREKWLALLPDAAGAGDRCGYRRDTSRAYGPLRWLDTLETWRRPPGTRLSVFRGGRPFAIGPLCWRTEPRRGCRPARGADGSTRNTASAFASSRASNPTFW